MKKRKKAPKFKQIVLVEFDNSGPWLETFVSNRNITIEQVAAYYVKKEDFNEDRDSITFVNNPAESQPITVR